MMPTPRSRRLTFSCIAIAAAVILTVAAYIGVLHASGNMHEVIPGELYRSAQLSPEQLSAYIRDHKIKTVLNLRGANVGEPWYDRELTATAAAGAEHLDFRMKASKYSDDAQLIALIGTMKSAPKPLLIHCQGGSDRTGLAAALYLAAIAKKSEFASELQLSLLYGHLPLYFNAAFAMNDSFEAFEPVLGYEGS